MARPVAAVGSVHYNGFDFPGPVQCQLRVQPVYDAAGRIVKYRRYTLTVECVLVAEDFAALSPGDPLDAEMKSLRYKLTQAGATLKYKSQGVGADIELSKLTDIEFGPKPQLLALDPVGSAQAWHLVWTVQFTPKECGAGIPASWGSMTPGEWWYSVVFSIAPNGLSVRTVTGSIEALVTRNAAGSGITFTADLLRERIRIPRLPGFNRQQNFDVSPDKRFLSFSFVDTQIPGTLPYPEGIVSMRIRQRVSTDPMQGYKLAQSRLSGSIEVVQGAARWYAWLAFLRVVQNRLGAVPRTEGRDFISIDRLEIEDEITGNEMSFSMGYRICTTKEHLLEDTGLWQPIEGDWSKWRSSMERLVGVRGDASLRHNISDDVVLNFCSGLQPRPVAAPFAHKQPAAIYAPFTCDSPSKEASWREYTVELIAAEESGTILNRPAAPWSSEAEGQLDLSHDDAGTSGKVETSKASPGETALTIQERSPPVIMLALRCVAERIGYPIGPDDMCHLDTVGGQKAVYRNQKVEGGKCGGNACGQPIYRMYWTRWYYVTKPSSEYTLRDVPDGAEKFLSKESG
jgi:hypothetical protein